MGTRSLTLVYNGDYEQPKALVNMYRQMDGYPSGHGKELCAFLKSGKLVNGITLTETERVFNGAGCLAAQLVSHFKGDKCGGFYLYPVDERDCWQEYEYHVLVKGCDRAKDGDIRVVVTDTKNTLFDGDLDGFGKFCDEN